MKIGIATWYIIFFVVAIILYILVEYTRKEAKPFKKKNLVYMLIFALIIGVLPFLALLGLGDGTLALFIVFQLVILLLGVLHIFMLYKILPWSSSSSFWTELAYSLVICFVGAIFMLFVLFRFGITDHYFPMLSSIMWFIIPYFFVQAVFQYISIPETNMNKWIYPLNEKIAAPTDADLASPVVIAFEFKKRNIDPETTVFRAKAPVAMHLGTLFYYFINDYNERHSATPIEVASDDGQAYGWIFYKKPKWYTKTMYLDFEKTIEENNIKENSVIVCQRVN